MHGLYKAVNSRFQAFGSRGGRKDLTRLSSWNVRSCSSTEHLERLVLEIGRKDLDFCAIQEVRLANQGTKTIKIQDYTLSSSPIYSYTLLFSGSENGGHHGVGILIKQSKFKDLLDWGSSEVFPERIIWAKFNGLNIISFYGFTETTQSCTKSAHTERKLSLYNELDNIYVRYLPHNIPSFICGDFNARIGYRSLKDTRNDPTSSSCNIGPYGDHREKYPNENGNLLTDFTQKHYLSFSSTFFQKPSKFKWTWKSCSNSSSKPGKFKACLDHILVHQRWKNCIQDCWTYYLTLRISDHKCLNLKFKMKFTTSNKKKSTKKKKDMSFLNDEKLSDKFVQNVKTLYRYKPHESAKHKMEKIKKRHYKKRR